MDAKLKVAAVYGNPKENGFVHGCLDHIASRLERSGVEVEPVKLIERDLRHCRGCFTCLRTGQCVIDDEWSAIVALLREADGWLIGASVRNGYFPALYKTFFERITYTLAFTWTMFEKHVLAVGAVGMAGGKGAAKKIVGMSQARSNLSSFLFFRTGIPTAIRPLDVAGKLDRAADRFLHRMRTGAPPPLLTRLARAVDHAVINRLMVSRHPQQYAFIREEWKRKGYI